MRTRLRRATMADLEQLQVVSVLTFFNSYKSDADVLDMAIYTQHELNLSHLKNELADEDNEFYLIEDLDEHVILAYTKLTRTPEFEEASGPKMAMNC